MIVLLRGGAWFDVYFIAVLTSFLLAVSSLNGLLELPLDSFSLAPWAGWGLTLLPGVSLVIWIYLLGFRGQFWRTEPQIEDVQIDDVAITPANPNSSESADPWPDGWPSVCVVIPARNEADVLPITVRSLLGQRYPGPLSIVVVDDHSTDGTATVARQAAATHPAPSRPLTVLSAQPLPSGWTGKLWALDQGTQYAMAQTPAPDYLLLTDADIEHAANHLQRLVTQAQQRHLDMASVMVRLRCDSPWEKLLIPAFVFFFQQLYPFHWVNRPAHPTAAAAGGCILLRPSALQRIGGIEAIRHALIDDCALAHAIKWSPSACGPDAKATHAPDAPDQNGHPIWLGLSQQTRSLRPYPSLRSVWDMVARTAYTQLNYSPWLLLGTLLGMTLVYLVPVLLLVPALLGQHWLGAIACGLTWGMMAIAYRPSIAFYRCPPILALGLPGIALLYTLMTMDSARRYWQGQGGAWKGRTYSTTP